MKKVLVITYCFPPNSSSGSVRLGGLAKYLPEYGWEPILLTPELPGDPDPQFKVIQTPYRDVTRYWKRVLGVKTDKTLQRQELVSQKKAKGRFLNYIFNMGRQIVTYPDPERGWYPFAVNAGNELFQQKGECIAAIISTSPPITSHLIAKKLKAKWNIPWIADFRDRWTLDDDYSDNYHFVRRAFERRLERRTLSQANALVTVSEPWAESLRAFHKGKSVHYISNGFDPDVIRPGMPKKLTEQFTITYAGNFLNGQRDPSYLFEAMRDLVREGEIDPSEARIRIYGHPNAGLEQKAKDYGIQIQERLQILFHDVF